ncbi:MAG: hypothetical protein ACRBDL_02365 [Alphaproteobacteria bacterium]
MLKKSLLSFIASFILVGAFASTPTYAQYDGDTMKVQVKENSTSLFRRDFYTIEFLNTPTVSPSKFIMRLASYGKVSGCATITKPRVETEQINDRMKVEVRDSEIKVKKRSPRYTNYDCKNKQLESYFDIELDRDELIENGTKKISLESHKYGEFATSEVDITRDRIILKTKSEAGEHIVTFWFFPFNTVILHAPSAKLGQDVQDLIRDFAEAQDLTPLERRFKDFELPYNATHYAFFTDPTRVIHKQLNEVGENIKVGHITTYRTVYTANGPVEEPHNIDVYATLPGHPEVRK